MMSASGTLARSLKTAAQRFQCVPSPYLSRAWGKGSTPKSWPPHCPLLCKHATGAWRAKAGPALESLACVGTSAP
eukprot:4406124-Amphidinium_carterae.1